MRLLSSGSNGSGQLSLGHLEDVHTFTLTQFHPSISHLIPGSTIIDLVSSSTHALLLLRTEIDGVSRNILLGAGTNTLGQLGPKCALWETSRAETRWKPVDLLSGTGAGGGGHEKWEPVKIGVTWTTSFVVYRRTQDGDLAGGMEGGYQGGAEEIVVSCGSNDFGELGKAENDLYQAKPSDLPTVVDLNLQRGEQVELLRGGQRHVVVVVGDGTTQRVMGWGASRKGELDLSTIDIIDGRSNSETSSPFITGKGKGKGKAITRPPFLPPTELLLPISVGGRIVDIRLGASHTLALISDGSILAWGSDAKGQTSGLSRVTGALGIGTTWGGSYTLRHTPDGGAELLSQGANTYSQLLRPAVTDDEQGSMGNGSIEISEGRTVQQIAAGSEHLLVRMRNDTSGEDELWVGGWNEHGNLGLGDQADRARLTRVDLSRIGSAMSVADRPGGLQRREGKVKINGVWGGCAASWIWLEDED